MVHVKVTEATVVLCRWWYPYSLSPSKVS